MMNGMEQQIIRCRAWYNGKWYEPALVGGTQVPQVFNSKGDLVNLCAAEEEYHVCRYTGMDDRLGKPVWEHDIVRTIAGVGKINSVVIFRDGAFTIGLYGMYPNLGDMLNDESSRTEVIGNIYENPELLRATS